MNDLIHNSIREPKSVQRLTRTFGQSLSALDLAEPLFSLDENQPASAGYDLMRARNLSVLGVRRDGLVNGWVGIEDFCSGTIGECGRAFSKTSILRTTAGFEEILAHLPAAEHVFIEWLGEVGAVITRNELQKPPMRMWLFGAITLFDTNLTWAIQKIYPDGSWQRLVSKGRFEKASTLHAQRLRRGTQCDVVDCLQIKDKTDILMHGRENLAALGIASRSEAERVTRSIEKLRNHLAHAQELERSDLVMAARLASLIRVILNAEGAQRVVALQRAKKTTHHTAPAS